MTQFNIDIVYNWQLNNDQINEYAEWIHISKSEMNDIPGPPVAYFQRRLKALKDSEHSSTTIHIIPRLLNKAIGWGHLSVYAEDQTICELYVYITKEERNKGYGTYCIEQLLSLLPESVCNIEIPALQDQQQYLINRFHSIIESSETRGMVLLSQWQKDVVNHESSCITSNDIVTDKYLCDRVLELQKESIQSSEFITRIINEMRRFGTQRVYVISQSGQYILIKYNFEENEVVGFLDIDDKSDVLNDPRTQLIYAGIQFLKQNTSVEYFLTFEFDENDPAFIHNDFKYVNTLDHHVIRMHKK